MKFILHKPGPNDLNRTIWVDFGMDHLDGKEVEVDPKNITRNYQVVDGFVVDTRWLTPAVDEEVIPVIDLTPADS